MRAFVFDFDGLMADSEPLAEWAWNQVLAPYGHQLDDETLRAILGLRLPDSARFLCQHFDLPISPAEAAAGRDRVFLQAAPDRLRACAGLYPLLDELARHNVPTAVASSGHRRYLDLGLGALGLSGRFQAIAAGDEVAHGKPAPDVYLLAAERLGVPPAACIALEDAPLGVDAARAAGMVCIAVPHPRTAAANFAAHWVMASLEEVLQALDGLLALREGALEQPTTHRYDAAGGVVVQDGRVLLLRRPDRGEIRLPKGHIEPGESPAEAALRETAEESGYGGLAIERDLGLQIVTFEYGGRYVVRTERYFRMGLTDASARPSTACEEQFEPIWLPWEEAIAALTYAPEREWVRRAGNLAYHVKAGQERDSSSLRPLRGLRSSE